jgi:hypothetical protein
MRNIILGLALVCFWVAAYCTYRGGKAKGYALGYDRGKQFEIAYLVEVLKQGHVYLVSGAVEVNEPNTTIRDCIFVFIDPNDPMLHLGKNIANSMVLDCKFVNCQNTAIHVDSNESQ